MSDYNDGAGAQAQQLAPAEYTSGTEKSHESENPHAREVVSDTEGTSKASMKKYTKLFSVISYLTWFCWIAAFFLHDKDDKMARHHLNQSLAVNVLSSLGTILARRGGLIGLAGGIIDFAALVFLIMGIYRAVKMSDEPLPFIGDLKLLD